MFFAAKLHPLRQTPFVQQLLLSLQPWFQQFEAQFPCSQSRRLHGLSSCAAILTGCLVLQVTYNGTGMPNNTDLWTQFGLTFNGSCSSNLLTSYGRNGLLGMGPGNMTVQRPSTATAG